MAPCKPVCLFIHNCRCIYYIVAKHLSLKLLSCSDKKILSTRKESHKERRERAGGVGGGVDRSTVRVIYSVNKQATCSTYAYMLQANLEIIVTGSA